MNRWIPVIDWHKMLVNYRGFSFFVQWQICINPTSLYDNTFLSLESASKDDSQNGFVYKKIKLTQTFYNPHYLLKMIWCPIIHIRLFRSWSTILHLITQYVVICSQSRSLIKCSVEASYISHSFNIKCETNLTLLT